MSREIVGFSAFVLLGLLNLMIKQNLFGITSIIPAETVTIFGYSTIFFGAFTLVSIDMVYSLLVRNDNLKLHSAMVCLTGILLFGWVSEIKILIYLATLAKSILYIWRKTILFNQNTNYQPFISFIRVFCLIILLIGLLFLSEISIWLLIGIVFLGEIIDRCEFYYESDVQNPKKAISDLFQKSIKI